jgi:hypothetical protein
MQNLEFYKSEASRLRRRRNCVTFNGPSGSPEMGKQNFKILQ